jgi:NADH-quinone oxidoreductase subunit E
VNQTAWKTKVDEVLEQRGNVKEALLSCLEVTQETCGYVPREAVTYLRENLGVPSVDIYGVITFYGMLTTTEQGKYIIRLCNSLPCRINNSQDILEVIEKKLGIKVGETSVDKKFSLEVVACLGLCDQAPAMMINDKNYGNLTADKTITILSELKG